MSDEKNEGGTEGWGFGGKRLFFRDVGVVLVVEKATSAPFPTSHHVPLLVFISNHFNGFSLETVCLKGLMAGMWEFPNPYNETLI